MPLFRHSPAQDLELLHEAAFAASDLEVLLALLF